MCPLRRNLPGLPPHCGSPPALMRSGPHQCRVLLCTQAPWPGSHHDAGVAAAIRQVRAVLRVERRLDDLPPQSASSQSALDVPVGISNSVYI